jgi:hypothetical protein
VEQRGSLLLLLLHLLLLLSLFTDDFTHRGFLR